MVLIFTKVQILLFYQVFHQSPKVGSFCELFYANRQYFEKSLSTGQAAH